MSFSKVGIAASSFPDKDKWVDVKEQRTTGLPWAVQPIFELQPGICCAGFPLFARNKIFSPPAEVMDYKGGGGEAAGVLPLAAVEPKRHFGVSTLQVHTLWLEGGARQIPPKRAFWSLWAQGWESSTLSAARWVLRCESGVGTPHIASPRERMKGPSSRDNFVIKWSCSLFRLHI